MNKLIEAEDGVKYWTSDDELRTGDMYVFCDPASDNPDEWSVGVYKVWPTEGGRNVLEVICPGITRRKIIETIKEKEGN